MTKKSGFQKMIKFGKEKTEICNCGGNCEKCKGTQNYISSTVTYNDRTFATLIEDPTGKKTLYYKDKTRQN